VSTTLKVLGAAVFMAVGAFLFKLGSFAVQFLNPQIENAFDKNLVELAVAGALFLVAALVYVGCLLPEYYSRLSA